MGQELTCTVRQGSKSFLGKAQLETSEILVRGGARFKIPFESITSVSAKDGELYVRTKDGVTILELGPKAQKWREKIANPKSLVEKLGPKKGDAVTFIGEFDAGFLRDLNKVGAVAKNTPITAATNWVFLLVESRSDLEKMKNAAKAMRGATALWVVYLKGQKTLTENDVRGRGLKSGLTDVKVVKFSETHTAQKFVIPVGKR